VLVAQPGPVAVPPAGDGAVERVRERSGKEDADEEGAMTHGEAPVKIVSGDLTLRRPPTPKGCTAFRPWPPLDAGEAGRHHVEMHTLHRLAVALTLALALLAPGAALNAQLRPDPVFAPGGARWTPIVGPRFGWSVMESSPVLGAQVRLPLPIPVVRPSITAGGDLVFQSGLREAQGTLDLTTGAFVPLYVGGGPALLNTIFEDAPERQTRTGYSLVAGLRGGRIGPFFAEIEFRWIRVAERKPRFFTISLGYPLLGGR
jgi:hypothetical protein